MRRPVVIVLLLLLLAAFGAACGGDNPVIEGPTTSAPDPTDEPTVACDDQTGVATAEITIVDSAFDPQCVIVEGDSDLSLVNNGGALHNFTIANSPVDVDVDPGTGQELSGPSPVADGEHVFYCEYHGNAAGGGMAGTITIV